MLLAQSEYFKGFLQFNDIAQHNNDDDNDETDDEPTILTVREHSLQDVQAMVDFIYLGKARVNSNDLVDLLSLCQEYLLVGMK